MIIYLACFLAFPMIWGLYMSFTNKTIGNPASFVGLKNYIRLLGDPEYRRSILNTVFFTAISIAVKTVLGMLMALSLNQKFKGRAIFRTLVFIPWLVPIIVAGMTWDWMLNPDFGIINYLLLKVGLISEKINFLGDSRYAMATVIFVNIWRSFPYYTISFLSAMQSIPADLNEAAAVDGAGMFTRFFKITLPQLKSVSLVIVFIHIIWTAINFDFIWVMTEGGPNYATETLPIMIYRYSMKTFDVGAASALSTMMFTAMFIMFLFYYRKRMKISDDLS